MLEASLLSTESGRPGQSPWVLIVQVGGGQPTSTTGNECGRWFSRGAEAGC